MKRQSASFLFLILNFFLHGQGLTPADMSTLEESAYLELNNDLFIPGESLLASILVTDKSGRPSPISQIAYLEIIGHDKKPAVRFKTELKNGRGSAAIYLPSYLKTGNYSVICYTKWMRNYAVESLPQYRIAIVNPFERLPVGLFKKSNSIEEVFVTFRPEGGFYHLNQPQKVYFQARNQYQDGIRVSGKIIDSGGTTVCEFNSEATGSGFFQLTAVPGESYTAVVIDSAGDPHIIPLPIGPVSTVSMKIREDRDFIHANDIQGVGSDLTSLEMWVNTKRKLVTEDFSPRSVRKDTLEPGLLTIRVLDSGGEEKYQNTIRIHPTPKEFTVQLNKKQFTLRDTVKLLMDFDKSVQIKSLTLSVRQKIPGHTGSCWPDQKIRNGLISESHSSIVIPAIQNFSIPDLHVRHLPDLHGELISGKVVDGSGRPIGGMSVAMTTNSPNWSVLNSTSDVNGRFHFNLKPSSFNGNYTVYIDSRAQFGDVQFDDPFLDSYEFIVPAPLHLDPSLESWLLQRSIQVQIENAYFTQKSTPEVVKTDFQLNNQVFAHKTYVLDDFTRFPTIEDVIREYVSDVWLRKTSISPVFSFPFIENPSPPIDSTLILLNGVPVSPSFILGINQADVEKIDLFRSQIKLGKWEFRGVINFETFNDGRSLLSNKGNYRTIEYLSPKPFFEYPSPPLRFENERIPDFRTQLYWDPEVTSDELTDGISFFTSDVVGVFEVIFCGETNKGETIIGKSEFQVFD